MSAKSSIAYEGILVLLGRESLSKFIVSVLVLVIGDPILIKELINMDLIYFPEDVKLWAILLLAVFSILGPLVAGFVLKKHGNGRYEAWDSEYTYTMIVAMILTPFISLIGYSYIIQKFAIDIDPIAYLVFLPIVMCIVAGLTLKYINEGIDGLVEGIKNLKGDVEKLEQLK